MDDVLDLELLAPLPSPGTVIESNEGDGVGGAELLGELAAEAPLSTERVGERGRADEECWFFVKSLLTLAVAWDVSGVEAPDGREVAWTRREGRGGGGGGGGLGASSRILRREVRVRSTVGSLDASEEEAEESSSMEVMSRGS